jgi:hypothetical protein
MHQIEKYLKDKHNALWGQLFIKDLIPLAIKAIEEYASFVCFAPKGECDRKPEDACKECVGCKFLNQ